MMSNYKQDEEPINVMGCLVVFTFFGAIISFLSFRDDMAIRLIIVCIICFVLGILNELAKRINKK